MSRFMLIAGMKTQTPNESVHVNLPRTLEFPASPLTFRYHYSWTICRMMVCKYSLKRYQRYIQFLCRMFLRNLYCLRSAASFVMTAHSGQILSKSAKLNWKSCQFEIHPQSEKDHELYFISDPIVTLVQFSNQILPLLLNLNLFSGFCWILHFDPAFKSL
jgi:hypothetical protein